MTDAVLELDTKEWDALLQKMAQNLKRAQAFLRTAASIHAFQDIVDHFRKEEGPDGAWPARAGSTQFRYSMIQSGQWRAPQGMRSGSFSPTNKLLQLTGSLRQEILPGRGKSNIENHGSDAVRLFNAALHSARHDQGGGGIPARPFMWLSEGAQERILDTIAQLIMEDGGPGSAGPLVA